MKFREFKNLVNKFCFRLVVKWLINSCFYSQKAQYFVLKQVCKLY